MSKQTHTTITEQPPVEKENVIERIYAIIDDLAYVRHGRTAVNDQLGARHLSLAITHLEDAALRVGPPEWYREPDQRLANPPVL